MYRLLAVKAPSLCDVGILQKVGGKIVWHHVLFVSQDEQGMATVIAGNTGDPPGEVSEGAGHRVGDYTWYSIEALEATVGSPPA